MYILTCVCLNVRFRLYVHLYYTKAVLYYFCFYLFFFCFGTSCCLSAAARLCVYLLFFFFACLLCCLLLLFMMMMMVFFLLNLLGNWMNFFDTSSRVSFACEVICSRRLTVITLSYFTYEKNKKNNKWKYKKHWNAALY